MTDTTLNGRLARDVGERPGAAHAAPVVFVVDDDTSTLGLLRDVAQESGWAARSFTSLREFDAELRTRRPDLVILDDDLPDGSGGDRARELGGDRRLDGVPILVCTAAHPMRQAQIGAWAPVISKPFNVGEVERILHAAARDLRRMGAGPAG